MGIKLSFLVAVVPAIAMLVFIYHRDKREKEPVKFLVLLCILGAASTVPAAILELIFETVINTSGLPTNIALFVECFIGIGMIEELGKFLISTCVTWKNKSFNHSYDAIVYTTCVSLGFALLENILYVFQGGISTGIFRAFTAVPLHCGVGVIMGAFYGKARESAYKDDGGAVIGFMALAYVIPVIIHGAYDYAAFGTYFDISDLLMFFIILAVVYIVAIWLIFYCSNHDHRIDGLPETADIGYYRKDYKRFRQGYGYGYNNINNPGNYNPYGGKPNMYNQGNYNPYGGNPNMYNQGNYNPYGGNPNMYNQGNYNPYGNNNTYVNSYNMYNSSNQNQSNNNIYNQGNSNPYANNSDMHNQGNYNPYANNSNIYNQGNNTSYASNSNINNQGNYNTYNNEYINNSGNSNLYGNGTSTSTNNPYSNTGNPYNNRDDNSSTSYTNGNNSHYNNW